MLTHTGLGSSEVRLQQEQRRCTCPPRQGPEWSRRALADTSSQCQSSSHFSSTAYLPSYLLSPTMAPQNPGPMKRLPPKGLGTPKTTQLWASLFGHVFPPTFHIGAKRILWQSEPWEESAVHTLQGWTAACAQVDMKSPDLFMAPTPCDTFKECDDQMPPRFLRNAPWTQ